MVKNYNLNSLLSDSFSYFKEKVIVLLSFAFVISLSNSLFGYLDLKNSQNFSIPLFVLIVLLSFFIYYISFVFYIYLFKDISKKKVGIYKAFDIANELLAKYVFTTVIFAIFILLLFLALIIPGIIFMVYWTFWVFILIDEKKCCIEVLKKSFNLIKNNWWRTFGYIVLITLIIGFLAGVSLFLFNLIFFSPAFNFLKVFFNSWATTFFAYFSSVFFIHYYLALKKEKTKSKNTAEVKKEKTTKKKTSSKK